VTRLDMPLTRLDMPLTSRDVEDLYTLFLGSAPDTSVTRRCANLPLGQVLGEILQSAEFQAQVLTPLLLREALPHEPRDRAPLLRSIDWAQRRLPLPPASRSRLGAAGNFTS